MQIKLRPFNFYKYNNSFTIYNYLFILLERKSVKGRYYISIQDDIENFTLTEKENYFETK